MNAEENKKAPVALFLWKRPENTRKILSEIIDYGPPGIFLIIDGARDQKELEAINKVKSVINELLENKAIKYKINASDVHLGLFRRFKSGFEWIFSHTEEIIILEDDTIPSPSFFQFCNTYLNKFRNDQKVVAINGFFIPTDKEKKRLNIDGPFFKKGFGPWGWATWKDKFINTYQPHDSDLSLFKKIQVLLWIRNLDHFFKRYNVLKSILDGRLNVWAVQFQWNIMEQKKLILCSHVNLIKNNGLDEHAATQVKDWNGFINIPISIEDIVWERFTEFRIIKKYEIIGYKYKNNSRYIFNLIRRIIKKN